MQRRASTYTEELENGGKLMAGKQRDRGSCLCSSTPCCGNHASFRFDHHFLFSGCCSATSLLPGHSLVFLLQLCGFPHLPFLAHCHAAQCPTGPRLTIHTHNSTLLGNAPLFNSDPTTRDMKSGSCSLLHCFLLAYKNAHHTGC